MKNLELIRDILTSEKYCSTYDWGVSKGQLKEINYYYKIFENNIIDKHGVFIFISSAQSGKTFFFMNRIKYLMTYKKDFSIAYVMPSIDLAKKFSKDKLYSFLFFDDSLKKIYDKNKSTIYDYYFLNNNSIKIIWSSSVLSLCSMTFDEIYIDEIDRTNLITEEGNLIKLLEARIAVKLGKIIIFSSPTNKDSVSYKLKEKSNYYIFKWKCPKCNIYFNPNHIDGVQCPECNYTPLNNDEREILNKHGEFILESKQPNNNYYYYYVNGFCNSLKAIDELCIIYKNFHKKIYDSNEEISILNVCFGEYTDNIETDSYNINTIDIIKNSIVINENQKRENTILSIDVQANRIYYIVVYTYDDFIFVYARDCIFFNTENTIAFNKILNELIEKYKIDYIAIDVGYNESSIVKLEVCSNLIFVKGFNGISAFRLFNSSYKKNVSILAIKDSLFKLKVFLGIKKECIKFNKNILDEEFLSSVCSEQLINYEKLLFKRIHKRNDYLDCLKYGVAIKNFIDCSN